MSQIRRQWDRHCTGHTLLYRILVSSGTAATYLPVVGFYLDRLSKIRSVYIKSAMAKPISFFISNKTTTTFVFK